MCTFSDIEQLARTLRLGAFDPVFVEGENGAGKSFLGSELARMLDGTHLELDSFIEPPAPGVREWYRKIVDRSRLHLALQTAANKSPRIVEGVMLRDVLDIDKFENPVVVYVKRIGFSGWNYGHDLRLSEGHLDCDGPCPNTLGREVREYHDRVRPHELAEYFFERSD